MDDPAPARSEGDRAADAPPHGGTRERRPALYQRAELVVSDVLRGGVILSAAIMVVGLAGFYARYARGGLTVGLATAPPHSLSGVLSGLSHGDPVAIIALGLLVLLATPVVRVVISVAVFASARDRLFTLITLVVLAILLVSFVAGRGGA
jgi:uncharacterized membrane protein